MMTGVPIKSELDPFCIMLMVSRATGCMLDSTYVTHAAMAGRDIPFPDKLTISEGDKDWKSGNKVARCGSASLGKT